MANLQFFWIGVIVVIHVILVKVWILKAISIQRFWGFYIGLVQLRTAMLTLVLVALLIVALSSVDSVLCYVLALLLRRTPWWKTGLQKSVLSPMAKLHFGRCLLVCFLPRCKVENSFPDGMNWATRETSYEKIAELLSGGKKTTQAELSGLFYSSFFMSGRIVHIISSV